MDGFINSKIEAQTIYEIYRACRLCGAGAGYKMPIIQNVVDLDGAEVELKQKIRDCVQIEVHQDDKMPPLICELCVDKVNDFYEFLEMCRQTNKRTRLRLGLPPQTLPRGAPDAGDCILGITEPVFLNDVENEPSVNTRQAKKFRVNVRNVKSTSQDCKAKMSLPPRKVKIQPRSLRNKHPSPPRLRGTKRPNEDDMSLGSLQRTKRSDGPVPKSILKRNEIDENSLLRPRSKLSKEKEPPKKETSKRVQIVERPQNKVHQSKSKEFNCNICTIQFSNYRAHANHMRVHTRAVDKKPSKTSKTAQCADCDKIFINKSLLDSHSCTGVNCDECGRKFSSRKALASHKPYCLQRKKVSISPELLRKMKPMQIRVSRCDSLLQTTSNDHYDVSSVPFNYGLDKRCTYPYISRNIRIKSEPGYMVNINDDIEQAFDADQYVHWDSEDTVSDMDEDTKNVDSLSAIALKSIFSNRFLGKVPKKRRKVRAEKAFDSILNASDIDFDIRLGIDNIIDRLDDTVNTKKDKSGDNDSLFGDDKALTVTNDDFDALFGVSEVNDKTPVVRNEDLDTLISKDRNNDKDNYINDVSETIGGNTNINDEVENEDSNKVSNNESNERSQQNDNSVNDSSGIEVANINDLSNNKVSDENKIVATESVPISESQTNNDTVLESLDNNVVISNENSNIDLNKLNEPNSMKVSEQNNETNDHRIIDDETNAHKGIDNETNEHTVIDDGANDRKVIDDDSNDHKVADDESKDRIVTANETNEHEVNEKENDIQEDIIDNITEGTDAKENEINETKTELSTLTNEIDKIETSISTDELNATDNNRQASYRDYVNGEFDDKLNMADLEDLSDTEMDDKKLMAELDRQIGEKS